MSGSILHVVGVCINRIGTGTTIQLHPGAPALARPGDERLHHAGFGAAGDHSDDVEEQTLLDRQRVERLAFGQIGGTVMGGLASFGLEISPISYAIRKDFCPATIKLIPRR